MNLTYGTKQKETPEFEAIFKTSQGEALSMAAYEAALKAWPVAFEEVDVNTRFGPTHLIACGPVNGQPLLLLHGQEASATMWLYNIQDLSHSFQVYAVDTIGDIGKSRPVRLPQNRTDYADWLLDIVDQIHMDKVNLAGISYGGFLALNFAIAFPARVKRVVLLAPGIPNFGPPTFHWALYGMPMMLFPSHHMVERFIQGASRKGYSSQDPVHEQMAISIPNMRERNFMRPLFQDSELNQVKVPILLMIGDHEIMYSPDKALARAAQLIPNLKTEMIPNAGHFLNSDQPGIINDLLVKFISSQEF